VFFGNFHFGKMKSSVEGRSSSAIL